MIKLVVLNSITLFYLNITYSQVANGSYHLQNYGLLMSMDSTPRTQNDSLTLDTYLSEYWQSFILFDGSKCYFNSSLLPTDILRFQNHNLFSRYPLKCLNNVSEYYFKIYNDSLTFHFVGMNMPHDISIPCNDSTFVQFPSKPGKPITVIQKIDDKNFKYSYYFIKDEGYEIETKMRKKNNFKYPLGIKNKSKLEVLLFSNVNN